MKVIDLLNKIAKGEEVPKKIKYGATVFILDYFSTENKEAQYISENYKKVLLEGLSTTMCLNDEVEVMDNEEEKKMEFDNFSSYTYNVGRVDESNIEEYIHTLFSQQMRLIENQKKIIDLINDMRDKEC